MGSEGPWGHCGHRQPGLQAPQVSTPLRQVPVLNTGTVTSQLQGWEGCISHEVNHPEGAEGSDAPAEPEPWAWLSQPRHYHSVALTPLCCPCIEGCSVASLASAPRSRAPSLLPPRDNRRCLWTLPRCPVGKVTPHLSPYPSRQVTLLEGDEFGEEDGEGHGEGPLQQEVPTYEVSKRKRRLTKPTMG